MSVIPTFIPFKNFAHEILVHIDPMVPSSSIRLDIDPFEILQIRLRSGPYSHDDIDRAKRAAHRHLLRGHKKTHPDRGRINEKEYALEINEDRSLINQAADALRDLEWADIVKWAEEHGYGKAK